LGNYQYRIYYCWNSPSYGGAGGTGSAGCAVWEGPVSIAVGDPNLPKPFLYANATPVGPAGDPLYYSLTWNAAGASANSCKLRTADRHLVVFVYVIDWDRWPGWLATSGVLPDIGKVDGWELKCTGPGGSSIIGLQYF
jgi:hypothetical protein